MNINEHTTPDKLERYSFLWSEVRLLVAAIALFLGGIPPITLILRPYGLVGTLLQLSWIVSGVSAGYLLYIWNKHKTIFGGKQKYDLYAFFVMVVSGLNLGIVGLLGTNIGMSITYNKTVFIIVGALYLISAYHLHKRWKAHGNKLF